MNRARHEDCGDRGFIADAVHAAGILQLHADCEPPCPRKQAARNLLAHESPRTNDGLAPVYDIDEGWDRLAARLRMKTTPPSPIGGVSEKENTEK